MYFNVMYDEYKLTCFSYYGLPLTKGHKFKLRFRPSEGCLTALSFTFHTVVMFSVNARILNGKRMKKQKLEPLALFKIYL